MREVFKGHRPLEALVKVLEPRGQRLALLEGPSGCNRDCSYCAVPQRWDAEKASTLDQTRSQIDWLYDQGFRVLQYVGGEPLTPFFKTKEGLTFQQHTLEVVRYASKEKGMLVNVTTNGDYVDKSILSKLKEAGIDTLTFSLHSNNESGIRKIINGARMAAEARIPPIVSVVFTSDRADTIPEIAERCAENGIIFATTIVQEYGGGFSTIPVESKIPTVEQQKKVFQRLKKLKKAGFIRNNINYLEHATDFPDNSWKCDPNRDSFISIRGEGQGEIGVCSEVHTEFKVGEINLKDKKWRKEKQDLIHNCNNCLYSCTFESQNPNLGGDADMFAVIGLIKSGKAQLAEALGQQAVRSTPDIPYPLPADFLENLEGFKDRHKTNPILLFLVDQRLKKVTHPNLKLTAPTNLADIVGIPAVIYMMSHSIEYTIFSAAATLLYKGLTKKIYPYYRGRMNQMVNKEQRKTEVDTDR